MNIEKINSVVARLNNSIPKMKEYHDILKNKYSNIILSALNNYLKTVRIQVNNDLTLDAWDKIDYLVRSTLQNGEPITLYYRDYKTEPSVELYERDQFVVQDSTLELSFRREVNESELYDTCFREINNVIKAHEAEKEQFESRRNADNEIKAVRMNVVKEILEMASQGKTQEEIAKKVKFIVRI